MRIDTDVGGGMTKLNEMIYPTPEIKAHVARDSYQVAYYLKLLSFFFNS